MFCKYCGTKLPDDAIFCSKCGKQLISEIQNQDSIILQNEVQSNENYQTKLNDEEHNRITVHNDDVPLSKITNAEQKGKSKLLLCLIVLELVVCFFQGFRTFKSYQNLSYYQNKAAGMHFVPSQTEAQIQMFGMSSFDKARKNQIDRTWDNVYFAENDVKRNSILLVVFSIILICTIISYSLSGRR